MIVRFYYTGIKSTLTHRKPLKKFISKLFQNENKRLSSLDYIFCNDEFLLSINQNFLKHDEYTDVITFCFSELNQPIEGEVYISLERVVENAKTLGISIKEETHRVIFHAALHLCGYEDKTVLEKTRMRFKENESLQAYFADNRFHVKLKHFSI